MFITFVFAHFLHLASSITSNATTRAFKYHTFKFPTTLNVSDDELTVKDFGGFVRHHGAPNKTALRIWPAYHDPNTDKLKTQIFAMMKQSIYATQDRLKHLEKVLDKYTEDPTFRTGFIFSKLEQLLEDMRRIYSIAVKEKHKTRVKDNIVYYEHLAKKNVDITYIVEYMIAFHDRFVKNLHSLFHINMK